MRRVVHQAGERFTGTFMRDDTMPNYTCDDFSAVLNSDGQAVLAALSGYIRATDPTFKP